MLAVGLTGGIGSGKSTVAAIFSVLGIPVFDADSQARLLMEGEEIRTAVQQQFGKETYTDGKLNRKVLADIVFADRFKLELLNAIVHPVTIAAAEKWILQQKAPYVIKEAALLFEAGSAGSLDIIIGVYAHKALSIQRVMQRDNVTRENVLARINRQIDDTIKMKLCDFVLVNNEQQLLTQQVLKLHETLLAKSREREHSVS